MSKRLLQKRDGKGPTQPLPVSSASGSDSNGNLNSSTNDSVAGKSLDQSLELLARVTTELDQPEKTSPIPLTPASSTSAAGFNKHDSLQSISKAESFIKNVEQSISSAMSRRRPSKEVSPVVSETRTDGQQTPSESSDQGYGKTESGQTQSNTSDAAAERSSDDTKTSRPEEIDSRSQTSEITTQNQKKTSGDECSERVDTDTSCSVSSGVRTSRSSDAISLANGSVVDTSSVVRRSKSMKDTSAGRSILKRTGSMTKSDRSPVIDPQLAQILFKRRSIHGDVAEEEAEPDDVTASSRRSRPLSAAEEIAENIK